MCCKLNQFYFVNMDSMEKSGAANSTATKVYYHLDDSPTPYMSEVPVTPDRITLGDFKAVFTRKGYRYFCRTWDTKLNSEVKAEIVRDHHRLQRSPATGLFELFLLSPALPSVSSASTTASDGVGNADTLPRTRRKHGAITAASELASLHRHPLMDHHHHHHHLSALALSSIVATNSSSGELMMRDAVDGCPSGGHRVSMVTGATSSGANTLISKRAGEHLAELYNSTSEDPYNRSSTSAIFLGPKPEERSFESSIDCPPIGRPKRRKARHRRPYVPSTISSATDESSSSLPRIEEVKLHLQEAQLGLSVACHDGAIFIYNIQPDSAAEKCGHLEVGDQIVQIDNTKFEELSEKQALDMLLRLNGLKKTVTIYVAKGKPLNIGGSSSDKSDALSQFCETLQLDIGQWVESTKQANVEPVLPFVDIPMGRSKKHKNGGGQQQNDSVLHDLLASTEQQQILTEEKVGTSDEEQAAYMDRRNGVGPRFVPAVQQAKLEQQKALLNNPTKIKSSADKQPQQQHHKVTNNDKIAVHVNHLSSSSHPSAAVAKVPSVPVPLHAAMEPSVILRRMAHPCSGLDIRDRKWLKIPVPNSFIGDDMLDWLMCNVQGFKDRKYAKAFASTALLNGLIKHVVNISAFNEKCYFIFDDSILIDRFTILRREALQSKQRQTMEEPNAPRTDNCNANTISNNNNEKSNNSSKQQQAPESTTEITYMSSPSSPFLGGTAQQPMMRTVNNNATTTVTTTTKSMGIDGSTPPQLVIENNPKYIQCPVMLSHQPPPPPFANNGNLVPPLRHFAHQLPAWPVSPIPRELGSLETSNEYESMVQGEVNGAAQFDAKFDGFMKTTANVANNNIHNNLNSHVPNNDNPILLCSPSTAQHHPVRLVPQRKFLNPK